MARPFVQEQPPGSLQIEECHPGFNEVFFIPPKEKLEEAGLDESSPNKYITKILDINFSQDWVSIYPINTLGSHPDFLSSKYESLTSIVLEGFDFGLGDTEVEVRSILSCLPSGFVKDYDYGLGLLKDYRCLIDVLENQNFSCLVISKKNVSNVDRELGIITLNIEHFESIRKSINRVIRNSRSVSKKLRFLTTNNLLSTYTDSSEIPLKSLEGLDNKQGLMAAISPPLNPISLTKKEQTDVLNIVSKNSRSIANKQPEKLIKLRNDIELVSLEILIKKFKKSLKENHGEHYWHKLINKNPFILSLAFGFPIIKVHDEFYVGGKKSSGDGDKTTDFLGKNAVSNNTAIFEIKKPQTKLLNSTQYRNGVFSPSTELTGAVNQLLDQQYQLQKSISSIKETSRIYNIETYHVYGILIVGMIPEEYDKQKSLELFRGNSKGVMIVTFDEVLEKLSQLYQFLKN